MYMNSNLIVWKLKNLTNVKFISSVANFQFKIMNLAQVSLSGNPGELSVHECIIEKLFNIKNENN